MLCENLKALKDSMNGVVDFGANIETKVRDPGRLREEVVDRLVYNAIFNPDGNTRDVSRWLISEISGQLGIRPASIYRLYELIGKGEINGFTVPAINIRGMTYDVARAAMRSALRQNAGALIFEIARSEIGYTGQRPAEYAAAGLAAAIKENYIAPVFIQGDHFQIAAKSYRQDPAAEMGKLKALIKEAVEAGFYNIDIDTSTLVDLSKSSVDEQQRLNYELAAEMTAHIRSLESDGVTIAVGGEIGEVGGKNSTVEEFRAYMEGYGSSLSKLGAGMKGISKMSVQTGSTHGGIPLPDGSIARVKLDLNVHEEISRVARKEYGMAGTVQHGASTLPEDAFDKFPESGAVEIHLATGFQNMIFDSEHFPSGLRDRIYAYLQDKHAGEKEPDQTFEQFVYKTRKKAFGPFKQALWDLPDQNKRRITQALESQFDLLFKKLRIGGTFEPVKKYAIASGARRTPPSVLS